MGITYSLRKEKYSVFYHWIYQANEYNHTQQIGPLVPSGWVREDLFAGYKTTHSLGTKQAIKGCVKHWKVSSLKLIDLFAKNIKIVREQFPITSRTFFNLSLLITEVGLVGHGSTSCGARNVLSCPTKVHFVDVNSYSLRLNNHLLIRNAQDF